MGKIRIKKIGTDLEEIQKEKPKKKRPKPRKKTRAPGLKGGERVVSVGPTPEELEAMDLPKKPKQVRPAKEPSKRPKKRVHSPRYKNAKKKIDPKKAYPIKEAIKLLRQVSLERFNGTVEAHIKIKQTGLSGQINLPHGIGKKAEKKLHFKTEKKAPLLHLIFGKMDFKDQQLIENFQALIKAINPKKIKKAVIKSTISPGIKVAVNN